MDQKIRVNAAISYLFLGELFLLAKSNPNFNHPFIRAHSKNAVKIHFSFLAIIIAYEYFSGIFDFLNFQIPIIQLSINNIVVTSLFLVFTFLLMRGAYKANSGREVEDIKIRKDYLKMQSEIMNGGLSEQQKMLYIASYIPFIGIVVSARHPSAINRYGSKIGGLFSLILVIFILTDHPDILLVIGFLYICYVAYASVMVVLHGRIVYNLITQSIPDLNSSYLSFKAGVRYVAESVKLIFGGKDELSFEACRAKVIENDNKYQSLTNANLTSSSIVFSNKLIFIPVLNLIYLPKYILDKRSVYIIAIAQGLIITMLLGLMYYLVGSFYTNLPTILLFPIFLGIANIDSNPFYRIPIIFEIYVFLDKLTFGIFSKMKFLKEKKNEVKEVSFKVQ